MNTSASLTLPLRVFLIHPDAVLPVPSHGYGEDAGADLTSVEMVWIDPGETVKVHTGIIIEGVPGYEIQVRARGGLASKGIIVTNGPGTVDPGYRGEIMVLLHNLWSPTKESFLVKIGDRIAQMVVAQYTTVEFSVIDGTTDLSATKRGEGAFSSTGIEGHTGRNAC